MLLAISYLFTGRLRRDGSSICNRDVTAATLPTNNEEIHGASCEYCIFLIVSNCGVMFNDLIAYCHVGDDFEKTVINHRRDNFVGYKC
jgi:hypothetical protein